MHYSKSSFLRNQQTEISRWDFTEFPSPRQKSAGWPTRPQTEIAPVTHRPQSRQHTAHSCLPLPASLRFVPRRPGPLLRSMYARLTVLRCCVLLLCVWS